MNQTELAKTLLQHEGRVVNADAFPVAIVKNSRFEMSLFNSGQSVEESLTIELEVKGDSDILKKISEMRYCSIIPR